MRLLFFADIFGRPGRKAVAIALPGLLAKYSPDFVIGNAENLAGGRGVNFKSFRQMMEMGFHILTTGNHVWDNREILQIFEKDERLLRPANFPNPPQWPCPGRGMGVYERNGLSLCVINLIGRVFMADVDCPFQAADQLLLKAPAGVPILVDMHADATSEKNAMGWHLAGRVAAVVGSHSHVQTADERILPGGTAYITDVGLSGSFDSVIGLSHREVIQRLMTKRPFPYEAATQNLGVSCVVIDIDSHGKGHAIERIRLSGLESAANASEVDGE
jgi:2',3'-cyclic-nucleotide 2'-phosphodiesterase